MVMGKGEPSLEQERVCPSCGTGLTPTAIQCGYCKSNLGRCPQCRMLLVAGTDCIECDKPAVPLAPKTRAAAARQEDDGTEFAVRGAPFALYPLLLFRLGLSAAFLALLVLAAAATGLGAAGDAAKQVGLDPAAAPLWAWWAGVGVTLVLLGLANNLVRGFRLRRTYLHGQALEYRGGVGGTVGQAFANLLIVVLTAGLGLPWIYARSRRVFYRRWVAPSRGRRPLGFDGGGEEVIGRAFLTLLCVPAAIGTAGLAYPVIAWLWLKWDRSNLVVPDRFGGDRRLRFYGTFGGFYVRCLVGWILTLVTLGLYRPLALMTEWKWAAAQTEADDSRRVTRMA